MTHQMFSAAGLPDVQIDIQTQNPNLGKFWKVLRRKMLEHFITIQSILRPFGYMFWPFGNFFDRFLVIIGYKFSRFGTL
jgi:hypothetical protein